jgi:hypothetical protein
MSRRRRSRQKRSKPPRRVSPDPERDLRHLGYAVICGKAGEQGSPYALAREQLREDFMRRDEALGRAGCSAETRLARLRAFAWGRLAAIDHLSRDGAPPVPPANHTTTEA